jgi:hypothetical protein
MEDRQTMDAAQRQGQQVAPATAATTTNLDASKASYVASAEFEDNEVNFKFHELKKNVSSKSAHWLFRSS